MEAVTITQITPPELETLIERSMEKILGKSNKQHPEQPQDERLTRKQVCALYKISLPTLHSLMQKGLPFEKYGRSTRFRRQEVDNYFRNK